LRAGLRGHRRPCRRLSSGGASRQASCACLDANKGHPLRDGPYFVRVAARDGGGSGALTRFFRVAACDGDDSDALTRFFRVAARDGGDSGALTRFFRVAARNDSGSCRRRCCYLFDTDFKGFSAGPSMTSPVYENLEPWQGQSHVRSPSFHSTSQPIWVQVVSTMCSSPSLSL
ncbi:MAG: hypothetical protein K0Q63_3881, partial [Paenibacillus sp.]|nr:hypothetical protein [Paenibacillus sp.]